MIKKKKISIYSKKQNQKNKSHGCAINRMNANIYSNGYNSNNNNDDDADDRDVYDDLVMQS